jgi:hypothetical protein
MHRQVNAIAGRLSLRPPQRRSLEILDRVAEIVPPHKGTDLKTALATVHSEFPTVTDFEREFPSLCFALATGHRCPLKPRSPEIVLLGGLTLRLLHALLACWTDTGSLRYEETARRERP